MLDQELQRIVSELRRLPSETTWVEFKQNNSAPEEIGEYISALANAAALERVSAGYVVWGIENQTHRVVGTNFQPATKKGAGEEDLIPWLSRLLDPAPHIQFQAGEIDGLAVVLLEVAAAEHRPTQWKGEEFIRVGSYRKKLKNHPELEKRLWLTFESRSFEALPALTHVTPADIFRLLDVDAYFSLTDIRPPSSEQETLAQLDAAGMVGWNVSDEWTITNLGALLFARNLNDSGGLSRKAPRVIHYKDRTRVHTTREQIGERGYAAGFQGLFTYTSNALPADEVIEGGLRRLEPVYPDLAVRELIANMLIHQDFSQKGTGPTIEIFDDRLEITNPGVPLIDTKRFIDSPPVSRNEQLARSMRQMRVCEERGSGWDKIVFEIEIHQLPAPLIETTDTHTRVVLFGPRKLTAMQRDDRLPPRLPQVRQPRAGN
ncbi:ATP-binding protein [Nocardioides daeguensis]|uniref:Helix-turn-helix domain-containing protein n=1 Tax=Nocardioides daeguensis TaxID=908359 RepID=A0ABP6WEY6_9ACTN|nr:ATP-binding protein [Nocardioides daeguensis]MBV6727870.1 putative DNA binding domain-containing protein [Nocardioides daeguensis]MCR1775370.1 putative DNA binding domain-containing protein [Nocardioides daeguensis]